MGLNLTQNETRELLDTIMTVVEEKRMQAGQRFELAKRRHKDADSATRMVALMERDFFSQVETMYLGLAGEIDHVISDICGQDWRTR